YLDGKICKPRDVPAGTGKALDQACLDRVGRQARHDDGDRRGRLLGCQDPRATGTGHNDDVDVGTDEFGSQLWEEGDVPFRVAVRHDDVLLLPVTQLPQALLKGFVVALLPESLRIPGEK